jgi:hypothetical protein
LLAQAFDLPGQGGRVRASHALPGRFCGNPQIQGGGVWRLGQVFGRARGDQKLQPEKKWKSNIHYRVPGDRFPFVDAGRHLLGAERAASTKTPLV